jgi:hypothetical protein
MLSAPSSLMNRSKSLPGTLPLWPSPRAVTGCAWRPSNTSGITAVNDLRVTGTHLPHFSRFCAATFSCARFRRFIQATHRHRLVFGLCFAQYTPPRFCDFRRAMFFFPRKDRIASYGTRSNCDTNTSTGIVSGSISSLHTFFCCFNPYSFLH